MERVVMGMHNKLLFKFMGLFGDAKAHSYEEIAMLGFIICGRDGKFFKKVWAYVRQYWVSKTCYGDEKLSSYILTDTGDAWFREMAIRLGGGAGYYRNYQRTPESYNKYGGN